MQSRVLSAIFALCLVSSTLLGCGSASQGNQEPSATGSESATTTAAAADETQGDVQYVLYLGTNDKDTNQPVFSREESKEKVKEILINSLGGYTIQEAEGGWIGDDGTEYQEYTLVIHLSDTTEEKVHEVSDELIRTFNQSSVLIQKNVTQTEFYEGSAE